MSPLSVCKWKDFARLIKRFLPALKVRKNIPKKCWHSKFLFLEQTTYKLRIDTREKIVMLLLRPKCGDCKFLLLTSLKSLL